jgi:hypothetical protein
MSNIEDYGSDRYTYVHGADGRMQTGRVRTVLPGDRETNEGFETRMDQLARQLLAMVGIASVSLELERANGAFVKATVTVVENPREAPILPDRRPAGGRYGGARGSRGSGALRVREHVA